MTTRIVTIVGARPQFVKAATVSRALLDHSSVNEVIVHTGQHFDENMSRVFFEQLHVPAPTHRLDIHGGSHGAMTGRMLEAIERILVAEEPDRVLVYGDTNSTLAGALAAAKLHVPVAHVEAGLRSFDMRMPEEINRRLTDHLSDQLYCPTEAAVGNLRREGIDDGPARIRLVGDVMQDAALMFAERATRPEGLDDLEDFVLATVHRAENTDDTERLRDIAEALLRIDREVATVVMPLHPRTRKALAEARIELDVRVIEPVGYFEMLWLLRHAQAVFTDSGGLQKEAYFFGKPCVTLRDSTEWVELVDVGANELVGAHRDAIVAAARRAVRRQVEGDAELFGGGRASRRIAAYLAA